MSDGFEWAMLAMSLVTTVVWAILVVLAVRTQQRIEMAVVGLLAAIGMAASAVAYLQGIHLIVPDLVSGSLLHFIAGVGRGALFMGGLLALVGHSPTAQRPLPGPRITNPRRRSAGGQLVSEIGEPGRSRADAGYTDPDRRAGNLADRGDLCVTEAHRRLAEISLALSRKPLPSRRARCPRCPR